MQNEKNAQETHVTQGVLSIVQKEKDAQETQYKKKQSLHNL